MSCLNAVYKRLKKLFLGDKSKVTSCYDAVVDYVRDGETLEFNVNPFAPIDEVCLGKSQIGNRKKKQNRETDKKTDKIYKSLKIRRVLRFSESYKQSSSTESEISISLSLHPFDLHNSNNSVSRYKREFHELELLGNGAFGSVYRCLNRLDGCIYAIKRSRSLANSNYAQRCATNEVYANAVLNNHQHVVRYYSAWVEDDCMSIQQEYCNGGDLAELIERMNREQRVLEEKELYRLLLHVAEGLKYIHGTKLAHLDIKPENIFISKKRICTSQQKNDRETSNDFTNSYFQEEVMYKIGDLGHVTSIANVQDLEDEGDCRYLSKEILREDYTDLTKSDVFALGLTIYQAGGGGPLPKNGPTWHDIRNGNLRKLTRYSDDFNELLKLMIHPDPCIRPSAADLTQFDLFYEKLSIKMFLQKC